MRVKRLFFVVCLTVCLSYVGARVVAMQGLYNAMLDPQLYSEFYFHEGYDIYAGNEYITNAPATLRGTAKARTNCIVKISLSDFAKQCVNSGVVVEEQNQAYCFSHSYIYFDQDMTFPSAPPPPTTAPSPLINGGNLAQLHPKIRAAIQWEAAMRQYPGYAMWAAPPDVQIKDGFLCINNIPASAVIAIVGNFCADYNATPIQTWAYDLPCYNHFHLGPENTVLNLGFQNNFLPYLRSMLPTDIYPPIANGPFYFRHNRADMLQTPYPENYHYAIATGGIYKYVIVQGTNDPIGAVPIGAPPFVEETTIDQVYSDVDVIHELSDMWGKYYLNMFSQIDIKYYRKYVEFDGFTSPKCHTYRTTLAASAAPYRFPVNVQLNDTTTGATMPPKQSIGTTDMIRNFGGVFEFNPYGALPSSSSNPWLPYSYENNPWNTKSEVSSINAESHSYWVLSNLHCQHAGEFRFNTETPSVNSWNDAFYCWNTQVHKKFAPGSPPTGTPLWWIPPRTPWPGGTAFPPVATQNDNRAYHPDFAYFRDGRYFADASAEDLAPTPLSTQVRSKNFNVNNFKPFLQGITIYQQQIDWNSTADFIDPTDVSKWIAPQSMASAPDDWKGLEWPVYKPWCVYDALWIIKKPEGINTEEPGYQPLMELSTIDLNSALGDIISGKYCNFEKRQDANRAKKWVNGVKPVYFIMRFSEAIDANTFTLDIEDRFGNARCLISGVNYVDPHENANLLTPFYEYFDFNDNKETKFTFMAGSKWQNHYRENTFI